MKQATLALALLLGLAGTVRAEDAPPSPPAAPAPPVPAAPSPSKPTPPPTPEQAADAVLAAVASKDDATLKALASKDAPDPWLVADELIRREQHDAAEAFAKAAPRVDVERLPDYVAARRGKPDDSTRRDRLARAIEAQGAGVFRTALDELGAAEPGPVDDVVGVRLRMGSGLALAGLVRLADAASVLFAAGEAAERIGWLRRADAAFHESGMVALREGAAGVGLRSWERCLAIAGRRRDGAGASRALGNLGVVHERLGDYASALSCYERSLAANEALGDRAGVARMLGSIGGVHQSLGNYTKALSLQERALAAMESLGDKAGAARTLGNLGVVHERLGDYAKALSCYERALAAKDALGDQAGAARTLHNIGGVRRALGDYASALSVLERAMGAMAGLGDRAGAATALSSIGSVHYALGDYAKALSFHERALAAMESLGDKAGAARALGSLGIVLDALGDYAKALSYYERALVVMESVGDKAGAASVLYSIGGVQLRLGDPARALSIFERALVAMEALGAKSGVANTLGSLGLVHSALGDYAKALAFHERSLAAKEALGDRAGAARTLGNIGVVHQRLGDLAKSLSFHERALAAKEELGDRAGAAATLGNLGIVHERLGDFAKALAFGERALMAKEALGNKAETALTLGNLGVLHLRLGDYAKALTFARRAVRVQALSVQGLSAEEGAGARDSLAVIYDVGQRAAVALRDVGELQYFLDSGRAGALLEGLSARQVLVSVSVPEALRAEETKARAAETRAAAALRKALDGGDLAATKARRAELQAAQEQVAAVVSRIQREAKAGAAIVYPEAATLDEVRATLEAGDVLVLYALFDASDAAALVVERSGARIVNLGPRALIDAAAEAASEAFADDASDPTAALTALADLVVKPLALSEGTKRVLVSPAGTLSYVPFAALMPERTVVYVPSGTTYRLLREEEGLRGEAVLALGDPDYTTKIDERALAVHRGAAGRLVRLPATRDEALAIGTTTLLGADATEAGLRKALAERKRWRAVHLACHGLVNTERPALSSLAITAAGDDDGFLTCLDVFRMKVPADLVVLSACETGKGKVVKGEGIVGLTRAFMFAGSPRVLCSLWKVDDAATSALMTKFYELWNPRTGSKGLGTAEALRRAQEHVRSQEKWKHPYYWAAWVLWGLPS